MANLNMRIDDDLKRDTEALFAELGLNLTTATTMFYKQCLRCRGIPFQPSLDPLFSTVNQAHLAAAARQMDASGGTAHELIEVSDD